MSHVDPDLLALAALGEAVPDDALAHLAVCDECREEREGYARAVGAGRAVRPDDLDLPAPPVAVWEGIERAARPHRRECRGARAGHGDRDR